MGNCYNKITIARPVDVVWETVSDFHDLTWAPNVVTSVTKVGDKQGREVGAKRVLNDAFHETLTNLDEASHSLAYSIDDGPGPVAKDAVDNYIGVVKLSAVPEGTLIEWSSSFESESDNEVADFCNPIYSALLADLKKSLEEPGADS